MQLGLMVGYSSAQVSIPLDLIAEAEAAGFDSVWTAEAWGADAATTAAWIAAHTRRLRIGTGVMQLPGRSPAMTAMTAMTLDALSGGRFILGLGTSGPQVVEGWHGTAFDKPLSWMREYVDIVRLILERKAPLEYQGARYQIPYRGPGTSGLGKPLKSILHGRPDLPIYIGAMAPKSQAQAAEIADGLLLTCMHPGRFDVIRPHLEEGFGRPGARSTPERFQIAPTVAVIVAPNEDAVAACRAPLKQSLALYIGGMGARSKNFYKDYIERVGFGAEAAQIQALYLDGKKAEAQAAVPDTLVDTLHLIGTREHITRRFDLWRSSGATTLVIGAWQSEAIRLIAELNAR